MIKICGDDGLSSHRNYLPANEKQCVGAILIFSSCDSAVLLACEPSERLVPSNRSLSSS